MRSRPVVAMGLISFLLGCIDPTPRPSPFQQRDGAWYYRDVPVGGADAVTFTPFDDHYAKDVRRVYYGDTYRKGQEYYLVKHARVAPVEGADAATFVLMTDGYARDGANVYYQGTRFAVRDAASFQVLDYGFARDRVTGYYMREPVPGSDGRTFAIVDHHYARDSARVYYAFLDPHDGTRMKVLRLDDADVAAFRALDGGYATDGARVYFEGRRVEAADPATFVVLELREDSADARDARATYLDGRRRPRP